VRATSEFQWTALVAWRGDRAHREIASQGLIQFLVRNHPESLPRSRNVNVDDESPHIQSREKRLGDGQAVAGQQHEKGDKSPRVHPEATTDGAL